ncbi:hypothetical protein TVAG_084820 [Trichomonas vaginalis G3]|uniref:Centromere protein J C-terminal domain-containing protein n=1 Tax=Trichomonas vaginalis (strain ATCC PRA-98 / G3) TaxID=412133 RepID=A2F3S3_TRIV3|nr:centromere protein J family [Trichomonas vaginalis G3]EAY00445.1 hypothetical protein TVAG_084820 [Trichomonas vaginalis G3]KAI5493479.1 centromere protein J family [Trichomonas vaginalis G3]|eukprot:XP_001313374.1 hypothetical protein [Trichomonas vaginalis G3]
MSRQNKRDHLSAILDYLDSAESKLDNEINEMEAKLSCVTKKVAFDIEYEPEIKPKEYPLTKISKQRNRSKFLSNSSIQNSQTQSKLNQKSAQKSSIQTSKLNSKSKYNSSIKSPSSIQQKPPIKSQIDEINISGEVIKSYHLDFGFQPSSTVKVENLTSGVKRIFHKNGDVSNVYRDGTMKTSHKGIVYTFFSNGDKQQEFPDGTNSYKYAQNNAIEVNYRNGIRVIFFANGQIQHYTPDGKCEIIVPDSTIIEQEK